MALDLAAYRRTDGWLGASILYLEQTTSTNDLLHRLGEQGAPEGIMALAESQSNGRGRMQRRWVAPPGTSLLLSLLFRPQDPFLYHAGRTTMLCGLALAEAVEAVAALPVSLKWPNDLIVEGNGSWRKLAGMLSEIGALEDRPAFLVVGIGLNVNVLSDHLPDLAPNATSLLAELGHPISRSVLLDAFLCRAEALYAQLRAGWDPLPAWRAHLSWLGERVTVQTPTETLAGLAEDVDGDGGVLIRLADGSQRSFQVGDVTLRLEV